MRPPNTPPELHTWTMEDGYALRGRLWPCRDSSAATPVLYLHGIQSHSGWYEWSASLLALRAPLLAPDRRGSGLNATARGDTPGAERWLRDLDELAQWAQARFHTQRVDLVGVSWGGMLAAAWSLRRPGWVRRLLLIAPGIFPAVDIGLSARFRVALALIAAPTRRFPLPLDDPDLFTDAPMGRAFISGDALKLTDATARFLACSAWLRGRVARARRAALAPPLTLFLADRDRIILKDATIAWARRVSDDRCRVRQLSAAHTPEFDPAGEYADALAEWRDE